MKLIDKDALVAEIENLENTYKKCPTHSSYEEGLKDGRLIGYKDALYKIDTLEVKEIGFDLGSPEGDKSAEYIVDTKTLEVKEVDLVGQLNGFQNFYAHENGGEFPSAIEIAKHFFELGLKAAKGE